ncbi:hypothetical protein BLNAU_1698 [Blattamonas nauphoetae]|uniref:Uncharacterized protein n=1 Tax=Blattamonas nauphoetae TaxID=2049346 RepID=A0ABQ9YHF0_9EUKA|nr:hypothetical protein BLNAU_1698 [Blattamonas nauphoetae]
MLRMERIGSVGTPTFAALSQMPVRSAQPQPSAEGAPSQSRFGWMEHPWTEPEFETQVEHKRKEQQTSFVTWVDAQFCRILDLFISQSASAFSEGRDDWVYTLKVIREDEADCIQMLLVSSPPSSDGTFSSSALNSAQRLFDLLNSWFGTQAMLQSDSRRRLWNQIVVTVRSWEAVCSENAQTMPLEIQQLLDDLSSHMPAQNSLSDFWTAFSLITNAQPDTLREFDPFSTFLSTTPQCHVQAQADSFLSSLRNTLHPV